MGQMQLYLILILVIIAIVVITPFVLIGRSTAKREAARRAEVHSHKDEWPEAIIDSVLNKQITIGMTGQMARLAWGNPSEVQNKETTSTSSKIRWVYGTPRKGARYLWFTDDKVTKIQN